MTEKNNGKSKGNPILFEITEFDIAGFNCIITYYLIWLKREGGGGGGVVTYSKVIAFE